MGFELHLSPSIFMHTSMLNGSKILMVGAQLLVILYSMVIHSFHSKFANKRLLLDHPQKIKLYGCVTLPRNLVYPLLYLLQSIMITSPHFLLHPIWFFMLVQSISKLIFISFENISTMLQSHIIAFHQRIN